MRRGLHVYVSNMSLDNKCAADERLEGKGRRVEKPRKGLREQLTNATKKNLIGSRIKMNELNFFHITK